MIPVKIGIIDIGDETMREAASMLLPGYVFNEADVIILGAQTEEGLVAGAVAIERIEAPDAENEMFRLCHMEVLAELRRQGIGTVLLDAVTSFFAEREDTVDLTIWYDMEDARNGFGSFIDGTRLFDIMADKINRKNVYIALWNGKTFDTLEEDEE